MYRCLAIAALGAALLATPLWAQRRGGGGGSFAGHAGFASHGSFASHGGMSGTRGFGSSGSFHAPHFGGGFTRPPFHHPHFATRWPYYGYGGYYANPYAYGYGYPYYNDSDYYPSDNDGDSGAYAPDQGYQQQQQAEINRLEDEVERLRQQRDSAASSESSDKADLHSVTELVFRDKHIQEVQNYAISGQTFWIFDGQQAKRVPLSELDIAATVKANDARGVDFQLPR
jgi:hypothetical protein